MAPKRKKSTIEVVSTINEGESYTDFLCPICLELLIEPIQLPCKHELCSACFEPHLENASLCCPMCRKRISTWVRDNRRKNTLINEKRWNLIKTLFPDQVKCRMEGIGDLDTTYDEYCAPTRIIAPEGEVRKDYVMELKKFEQEKAEILQLDLECIKKLEDEEYEEMKAQEEIDRAAAHELQKQEMENLGVTLASPTEHQKKLLELLRPKSPMRLRNKQLVSKEKRKLKSKPESKSPVLKSPKGMITNYFAQSSTTCQSENNVSAVNNELPCSSKFDFNSDYELASKLQSEFYSQIDEPLLMVSSKRPLTVSNPPIT